MSLISPLPGILFDPPALFFEHTKTLILSDLHLGAENALHNKGFFIPKTQTKNILKRYKELIQKHKVQKIILAGDIKHAFGSISDDEWRDVRELIQITKKHKAELLVIKGNHDTTLLPILQTEDVQLTKSAFIENYLVIHGDTKEDEKDFKKAKGLIIGHEHPSLQLDDGVRKENYKCLLKGKYKHKDLLILPSTYPLVEGTNILENKGLGPIRKEATALEAYLIENYKAYSFGKIDLLDKPRQKV